MRLVLRALASCGLCMAAIPSFAEDANPRGRLPNLSQRPELQSVRFGVYGGRLQAFASEAMVERETSSDLGASRREKLQLSTNADQDATIQYELSAGSEQLTVEVVEGQQFTITLRPTPDAKGGPAIEFCQPKDGPITLSVSDRGTTRQLKGASLWHLLLADPQICRQHLLPLLEMFRPDWRLGETAQAIEVQMLRTAAEYRPETLQSWGALVADLASDRFVDRQRAERELRAAMPTVIPYLRSLDHRRLDFEQSSRIQQLVDSTDSDEEDRPDSVATDLMADRRVWLTLLDRPGVSSRRAAAGQLSFLFGETIQFDPTAAQSVRQRQLAALRTRVERESPAE
ncbi:MAG TPA: hypothetical protein VG056_16030 [Pirellulales bacterium]|jgi:hypothetical protein|nr:hypothetical protein [Pirellulales bacterium]